MKIVILLLCAYVVLVSAGSDTGSIMEDVTVDPIGNTTASDEDGKIIAGERAAPGQFPWQVGIFHTVGNNNQFCGGALISNQWVLTAAHCVYGARNFQVILGATNAYQNQPNKITMGILKALYHPDYNKPYNLNNDVAVIQLAQPVRTNAYIQPIRLPRYGERLMDNTAVWVSGWGKTSDSQTKIVDNLNYVGLTTISNQECRRTFIPGLIPDTVVCCRGQGRKSTCNGDSGGPLIQNYNGQWTSVGVVSFVSVNGCEKGEPNGFSRTESYLGFIYANTGLKQS